MKLKIFIGMILALISNVCLASQGTEVGYVEKLLVHNSTEGQTVLVSLDGNKVGGFCSHPNEEWHIALGNDASKTQYSLLLSSYLTGKKVKLWGNGVADCIGSRENIRNIEIVLP